jgi:prevent-host-death family protein
MADISVRDLRNEGGEILDSVMRGATVTVTRQGRPIAELRPIRRGTDTARLLAIWQGTPTFAFDRFRSDLAEIFEDSL